MADVVSSVTSLFSTVLQGFQHIQVARSFEGDIGLYQTQLAITQLRLSRWGEAVGVNPDYKDGPGEGTSKSGQPSLAINTEAEEVEGILYSINQALEKAKKESVKWKSAGDIDFDDDDDDGDDLMPKFQRLKWKIFRIVETRCRLVAVGVKGVKWALYKKEQFEALTKKILELIEQLEKAVESESILDELSHKESEVIGGSRKALLEAVGDCDPRLQVAASEQLEDNAASTKISISAVTNYGLQMGINRGEMKGFTFGTGNTITHQWRD